MLQGLNTAQRQAVMHPLKSQMQILAGPGTGKTKTLTSRVAYLIHQGVRPENMVVMTFTNQAAKEMKERITKLNGDRNQIKRLRIGTFHSICFRYLIIFGAKIGLSEHLSIADEYDKDQVIKGIYKNAQFIDQMAKLGYEKKGESFKKGSNKFPSVRAFGNMISSEKSKGHTLETFLERSKSDDVLALIFRYYQRDLEATDRLDFDDILLKCRELLLRCPEVVKNIEAVLVDEFQDSNLVQLELTILFAQIYHNITMVGDPDQSIYAFRNAQPSNISDMRKEYPDTKMIYLEENYRSSQTILNCATRLIRQDKNRIGDDRKLVAVNSSSIAKPTLVQFSDSESEATAIGEHIRFLMDNSGNTFEYSDFAILARTNKWMRRMELSLSVNRIPYRILGGYRFWDRLEVKAIIDYLRVVNSDNDKLAITRTLNVPKRGIGPATVTKVLTKLSDENTMFGQLQSIVENPKFRPPGLGATSVRKVREYVKLIEDCRELLNTSDDPANISNVIDFIISETNLLEAVSDKDPEKLKSRQASIDILKSHFSEAVVDNNSLEEFTDADGNALLNLSPLHKFLVTLTLDPKIEKSGDGSMITLSTIHSSKGLEWPVVYIADCTDDHIERCKDNEIEEERRCLFVAVTRAKALSYITFPDEAFRWGMSQEVEPNRFIAQVAELDDAHWCREDIPLPDQEEIRAVAAFLNRPSPTIDVDGNRTDQKLANDFKTGSALLDMAPNPIKLKKSNPKQTTSKHRIQNDSERVTGYPISKKNSAIEPRQVSYAPPYIPDRKPSAKRIKKM